MFLFVKARIRLETLPEFGTKLASGAFGPSPVKWTFCLTDDPTVGLSLWDVESRAMFEERFEQQRPYYAEVLEVSSVLSSADAMQLLLGMRAQGEKAPAESASGANACRRA